MARSHARSSTARRSRASSSPTSSDRERRWRPSAATSRSGRGSSRSRRATRSSRSSRVVAVFIYGEQTLPGLGDVEQHQVDPAARGLTALASAGQTLLILMGGFDLGVAGFIVTGAVTVTALQGTYDIPFIVAMAAAAVGVGAARCDRRQRLPPLPDPAADRDARDGDDRRRDRADPERRHRDRQRTGVARRRSPSRRRRRSASASADRRDLRSWSRSCSGSSSSERATGRRLFATGANERAAEYALVHTRRMWTLTFAFSAASRRRSSAS